MGCTSAVAWCRVEVAGGEVLVVGCRLEKSLGRYLPINRRHDDDARMEVTKARQGVVRVESAPGPVEWLCGDARRVRFSDRATGEDEPDRQRHHAREHPEMLRVRVVIRKGRR